MAGYGLQALEREMPHPAGQQLAKMGMQGDDTVAHLDSGELVIPKSVQSPGLMALVAKRMRRRGMNPERYRVGSQWASKNPRTGLQQFFDVAGFEGGNNPGGFGEFGGGGPVGITGDIDAENAAAQAAMVAAAQSNAQAAQNNAYGETQAAIDAGWNSFLGGIPSFIGEHVFGYTQTPNPDDPTQVAHMADPTAMLGLAFGLPGALVGRGLNMFGDMSFNLSDITNAESLSDTGGAGDSATPERSPVLPTSGGPVTSSVSDIISPVEVAQAPVPSVDYYRYGYSPEILMYPWERGARKMFGQYKLFDEE